MSPQEAIDYFGSQRKLAAALGITVSAPAHWARFNAIPIDRQCQIEIVTDGALKADRSLLPGAEQAIA